MNHPSRHRRCARREATIAGCTGKTSEDQPGAARPPHHAMIDMGDFVGGMLTFLRAHPVPGVAIGGGRQRKLAQGNPTFIPAAAAILAGRRRLQSSARTTPQNRYRKRHTAGSSVAVGKRRAAAGGRDRPACPCRGGTPSAIRSMVGAGLRPYGHLVGQSVDRPAF